MYVYACMHACTCKMSMSSYGGREREEEKRERVCV